MGRAVGLGSALPRDADLPLGAFVPRRQVVVADRPVGQRGTFGHAVSAGHVEIVAVKAPGLRAVDQRARADGRSDVLVASVMRGEEVLGAVAIDEDARVAVLVVLLVGELRAVAVGAGAEPHALSDLLTGPPLAEDVVHERRRLVAFVLQLRELIFRDRLTDHGQSHGEEPRRPPARRVRDRGRHANALGDLVLRRDVRLDDTERRPDARRAHERSTGEHGIPLRRGRRGDRLRR